MNEELRRLYEKALRENTKTRVWSAAARELTPEGDDRKDLDRVLAISGEVEAILRDLAFPTSEG